MGWKRKLWFPSNEFAKDTIAYENWETGWRIIHAKGQEDWSILDQDGFLIDWADTLEEAVHYAEDEIMWEAYCKEREKHEILGH